MASVIRIKRSSVSGNPNILAAGELAYSAYQGAGGDRLYIGMGTETNGNAVNHVVIGGKYFTDMLDHATGTLTANSAILVDGDSKIDNLKVDNLDLNGNTISSTDTNGNILLDPAGTGYVQLVGTNGVVIPVGTTAQRGPSTQGTIRYNTDTSSFEGHSGTAWGSLGGVKSVDGLTYITPGASDDILHFYASNGTTAVEVAQLDVTDLSLLQTTQSTSSTTGALIVAGGVGIAKNLNVGGNLAVTGTIQYTGGATFNGNLTLVGSDTAASAYFKVQNGSAADKFVIDSASGNTTIAGTLGVIGNTTLSANASVGGTLGVTGATTLSSTLAVTGNTTLSSNATVGGTLGVTGEATLASATVSDLTSGRVVLAGTAGALQDSASLTFNGTTLTVTGATSVTGNSTVGGTLAVSGATSINGALNMNAQKITNLAEPTADSDAATKYYVDAARSGLDIKNSVKAATTGNIDLSGTQIIDDVALSVGDRVLVKDQANPVQNGIYIVASGSWNRSTDADHPAELNPGTFVFVEQGTVNDNTGFVVVSNTATTIGIDQIIWTLFSTSGTLVAGAGLSKTGYTLDVNTAAAGGIEIVADNLQLKSSLAGAGLTYASGVLDIFGTTNRITVNADNIDIASTYVGQSSITTLGTITTGTWTGSVIADAHIADNLTISGGTINNTPIGGTARSSGAFTTLAANDAVTFTSTAAISGNTTIGGTLGVTGNVTLSANLTGAGTSIIDGFDIDGGIY